MVIRTVSLNQEKLKIKDTAIAIGFFDGVHLGHRRLFDEVIHSSYIPSVLTFSQDMKENLSNKTIPLLLNESEKEKAMEKYGIRNYFLLPFDSDVRNASKDEFLSFILSLNPRKIVVGEDFTFAKEGKGKAFDLLVLEKKGISVSIIPLLKEKDIKISTRTIRENILQGRIEEANEMLGYRFFLKGVVIHGLENGRKIGFPTANMECDEHIVLPKTGVYQTMTRIGNEYYRSMTNIGNHPTVSELEKEIIETHLIDFSKDIYGKEIEVIFLKYLRPQTKFMDLKELKNQLHIDLEKCK